MAAAAFSGTAVIAAADTEVQLRSTANTVKGGNIMAPLGNEFPIRVGPTGVTDDNTAATAGYLLVPGKDIPIIGPVETNIFYIRGKVGDRVYFIFYTS